MLYTTYYVQRNPCVHTQKRPQLESQECSAFPRCVSANMTGACCPTPEGALVLSFERHAPRRILFWPEGGGIWPVAHVLSSVSDFNFFVFTILVANNKFAYFCGPILKHPPGLSFKPPQTPMSEVKVFLSDLPCDSRPRNTFHWSMEHHCRGGHFSHNHPSCPVGPLFICFCVGSRLPSRVNQQRGVVVCMCVCVCCFFLFFLAATKPGVFVPPDCPGCSRLVSSSPKKGTEPKELLPSQLHFLFGGTQAVCVFCFITMGGGGYSL